EQFGLLQTVISQCVKRVHVGAQCLDMHTVEGRILWQSLGMVAVMERDLIVQRLVMGKVHAYNRGIWIPGKLAVPIGYALKRRKLNLSADPRVRADARYALELIASGMTAREFGRELGRRGVSSPRLKKMY